MARMYSSRDDSDLYRMNYSQHRGMDSRSIYGYNSHHSSMPILELRVPMCCEKCQEKVKEELEELEGVRDVIVDQYNQRVTITGYVDPLRALKKVKKVKKKSEFWNASSYIDHSSHHTMVPIDSEIRYSGKPLMHSSSFGRSYGGGGGGQLVRTNSYGRSLGRLPSFGRVTRYDGDRRHDLEPMDLQRDYYGVRRMPSFNRHRYHDAEYIADYDQYTPHYGDTHYVAHHSMRPTFRSQVSFSKLPVTNPYYMQHIESEYY